MKLLLILVAATVLVISLAGAIMATTSPTMIDEETTLLSYQHKGRFDYTVYLKPSYLFWASLGQLPTSYKYPAALVDTIDFTFSYHPYPQSTAQVWVNAVLQHQDIWRKEIELAPLASVSSDFSTRFSLDVAEITGIFEVIQQETGISVTSRSVNIEAHFETTGDNFTHSLPISLSNTLIEVNGNLTSSFPTGTTEFTYVVNLKPNSLYNTTTLTSPPSSAVSATLRPGDAIFPKLVDKMFLTYYYQFAASESVDQLATDLEIKAILEAPDVWTKEFPLLHEDRGDSFSVSTVVDLAGYLQLLENIRTETGIPVESYNLTLIAHIRIRAMTPFGGINDTFIQSMVGTIKTGILTWESPLVASQPGGITSKQTAPNPKTVLGLSVVGARVFFPLLSVVSFVVVSLLTTSHFLSRGVGLSEIEQEVLRIKKKYGNRLVESTSQTPVPGERTISIASIESLVNIADELGKLIIYEPSTERQKPHAYYLFDGITRYQYLLGVVQIDEDALTILMEFSP